MRQLNKLSLIPLTLLITGAIDSIRNLPATAFFGSTIIFFFILAAIMFLIPTALVSAELAANIKKGGIFEWGRLGFNAHMGFLAVWLQWVNNIVWFPTILSFIAGTAAYLVDPGLAQNKLYLVTVILSVFWFLTFLNLKGIRLSAKVTTFCALVGLVLPMLLIIILLGVWLFLGNPLQIHLTHESFFPNFHNTNNWISLTAIMMGFAGMELATVHISDVKQPQKTFPRALSISTLIILITMILGSLSIAFVIPQNKINLVDGTIQTFAYFLSAYHLTWLTPILTILLVIGSFGGIISWVISPIKGISQAAQYGFLPQTLQKLNKHGVPQNLLISQAILVSAVCISFLLIPSVNGSYWFLSSLSTQMYILMYVIMFLSILHIRKKVAYQKNTFIIPGKKWGVVIVAGLGLIGAIIGLAVGFIPPNNMDVGSHFYYETLYLFSMGIMILPICFFYWYQRR